MLARVITGLIGVPIVIALVFYRNGLPFTILVGLAAIIGLLEFYAAARKGGAHPNRLLGLAAGVLVIFFGRGLGSDLDGMARMVYLVPVFTGFIMLSLAYEVFRKDRAPFVNVGVTVLGVTYVAWLFLHLIWLRNADRTIMVGRWESELGAWLALFVLLTAWTLDTGAYLIGRFYGTRKLAPVLSPGKTIEGSVAGFVLAVVIAAVAAAVIRMPQPHGLILGALIGITGQVGDLAKSGFKREVGIKDFGSVIPGHGGVLDRVDSLLFAGPVTFWYLVAFLPEWLWR